MSKPTYMTKWCGSKNGYTIWFQENPSNSPKGIEPIWDFISPLTREQCTKHWGLSGRPSSWLEIQIHDKKVLLLFQLGWEHLVRYE